jgi:hypothetical protein
MQLTRGIQQTEHGTLTVGGWEGTDAHINAAATDGDGGAPILRLEVFRHIHTPQHFDAADQRLQQGYRQRLAAIQHPVNPVAEHEFTGLGLQMEIAGTLLDRTEEQTIQQLDHRRFSVVTEQIATGSLQQICHGARPSCWGDGFHRCIGGNDL